MAGSCFASSLGIIQGGGEVVGSLFMGSTMCLFRVWFVVKSLSLEFSHIGSKLQDSKNYLLFINRGAFVWI